MTQPLPHYSPKMTCAAWSLMMRAGCWALRMSCFHAHCWRPEGVTYLQDLFTLPEARGTGVGRALIEGGLPAGGCTRTPCRLLDNPALQYRSAAALRPGRAVDPLHQIQSSDMMRALAFALFAGGLRIPARRRARARHGHSDPRAQLASPVWRTAAATHASAQRPDRARYPGTGLSARIGAQD